MRVFLGMINIPPRLIRQARGWFDMQWIRQLPSVCVATGLIFAAMVIAADPITQQTGSEDTWRASTLAEPICLLHGWVNSSSTHNGIQEAIVSVSSDDYSFHNYTYTNETGYFEIDVPREILSVQCMATGYFLYESDIDTTGEAEHRLDIELVEEPTVPAVTMALDYSESISQMKPLIVNMVVEDFNLRVVSIGIVNIYNRSGEFVNFTYGGSGGAVWFHEWDTHVYGDFVYTYVDDTFEGEFTWPATVDEGGYLVTSNEREHVWANGMRSLSGVVSYGISAFYTNDTAEMIEGLAWFGNETGEYEGFQIFNSTSLEFPLSDDIPPEESGVITPFQPVQTWKLNTTGLDDLGDWYQQSKIMLDPRPAMSTAFEYNNTALSGYYMVFVTAYDEVGNLALADEVFTVDTDPPTADAGGNQVVSLGDEVVFDGSGSDDNFGIVDFAWEFEDSGEAVTLHGEMANYTFDEGGMHEVTLTVMDAGLNEAQDVSVVWVDSQAPVAEAGPADMEVPEDVPITFNASFSTDDVGIGGYSWTITELEVGSTDKTFTFTFDQPGTYHVELVVTDKVGQVSEPDVIIVTVTDETAPVASAGEDRTVLVGEGVVLNGSASTDNVGLDTFVWTGDDGSPWTLMGTVVVKVFSTPGTYEVTLEAFDCAGNSDTATITVTVVEPPLADAGEDIEAVAGDVVVLNASGSSDDLGIANYTWAFEHDGETVLLYGEVVEFAFEIEGVYDINLTVTDDDGLKGYDEVTVTVAERQSASNLALYAAVGIVVAVALVAIGVMLTRPRKSQ